MTRCTCGHSNGVHAYTNQIGSCAFPGCKCMRFALDLRTDNQRIADTIKRVAKEDLELLKRLAPNDKKGT